MPDVWRLKPGPGETQMPTVTVYHFTCPTAAGMNRLATREAIEALPGAERILCTGVEVDAVWVKNGFLSVDYDWTQGGGAPGEVSGSQHPPPE
jgi:hypothetical protein